MFPVSFSVDPRDVYATFICCYMFPWGAATFLNKSFIAYLVSSQLVDFLETEQ